MFGSKKKKIKQQTEIKELLSLLYNGVSKPEYGDSYDGFKDLILETYKKVDQGKWSDDKISDIIATIQHIAVVNYKFNIETPEILSEVRPKLEKYIRKPLLGLWIYHS